MKKSFFILFQRVYMVPVLTIHLILMRIRILDQHWEKMDPDPGHFFKIYWIFLTKNNFQFFFIFFRIFLFHNFMNHEIIQEAKILYAYSPLN